MSWNLSKLGDNCTITSSRRFHLDERKKEGVPFYSSKEVIQLCNGESITDCQYISDEAYEDVKCRFGVPKENDLLLTTRGTYGIPYLYRSSDKFYFSDGNLTWFKDFGESLDSKFLYYWFKSSEGWGKVDSIAKGTAQKAVPIDALKDLEIPLPPLPIQRRIADILSAYDDLIENNQRQIKLLEEAAMQLYREWFVFMRFPGHESVRIVDGVSDGWEKKCLRHLISYEIGGGWGNDDESGGFDIRTWVIRGTDIDGLSSGKIHSIPLRFNKQQTLSSRMLSHGDIIFEVSGGSKNVGVAKSYLITQLLIDYLGHPVICASFCKMIRPTSLDYAEYLYSTLRHLRDSGITEEYELKSASSIINFKWADFLELHFVLIPPETILRAFNGCISPIYTKIVSMSIQVETLQKARDALLPRLMNGGEGLKLEEEAV